MPYDPDILLDPDDEDYPLMLVRFYIGDVDPLNEELKDAEIQMLLANSSTPLAAAIMALRGLIVRYSRNVDKWVGDLKILNSQKVKNFTTVLDSLINQDGFIGRPSAGGIYVADKESQASNASLVQGQFSVGMDDNTQE